MRTHPVPRPRLHDRCRQSFAVELLEHRRLLSTSTWSSSTLTEFNDYAAYAAVRYGDNGYSGMYPGMVLGTPENAQGANVIWDSDMSDGLQSNLVGFEFSMGTESYDPLYFGMEGVDTLKTNDYSCQSIGSVIIRAAVLGDNMAMLFQQVFVAFYRNGEMMESYELGSISADTFGSATGPLESGVVITPSRTDYDFVYVSGLVELRAAEGVSLVQNSIFGDVYIRESA